jgi:lipoprotein-anchoring transpeptidase ErfK/SrfK
MHDTIDERLAQLGGSLEAAAEVRSPTLVRSRGEEIRIAHRRRVVAVTATSAAVAMLGVGSLAFRSGGGHQGGTISPGVSGSASAPVMAPPSGAAMPSKSATASAEPVAVVDVKQDTMTVYDKSGRIVKTVPVTAGKPGYLSPVGVYTVNAKEQKVTLTSTIPPGPDSYSLTVYWVIDLDAGGPRLYAAPWAAESFGKRNTTHGEIGMSTESAQWLYNHVAVGDRIQIR